MVDKNKMIIEVGVKDDTAKGTASVNKNQESMGKTAEETSLVMEAAWAAAFAAVAIGVTQMISVTAEFQRLNAMLKVATGSAKAAQEQFNEIKKFAAETPFSVQQVTNAFIKLKNLGLDPSMEALRSYGNTASAMGLDVMQFIEAVADASVGEFERLKEFGIKASRQGEEVEFTFKGLTTTVKNSADDIQKFLKNIGDTDFAGSMEEQMNTIGGAESNVSDATAQLANDFFEASGGARDYQDALTELASAIHNLNAVAIPAVGWPAEFAKAMTLVSVGALDMSQVLSALGTEGLRALTAPFSKDAEDSVSTQAEKMRAAIVGVSHSYDDLQDKLSRQVLIFPAEQRRLENLGGALEKLRQKLASLEFEEAATLGPNITEEELTKRREAAPQDLSAQTAANAQMEELRSRFLLEQEFRAEQSDSLFELEAAGLDREEALRQEKEDNARLTTIENDNWRTTQREMMVSANIDAAQREADAKARIQAVLDQELATGLANLGTLMDSESRKAFELGKTAKIASTLQTTYESATNSYNAIVKVVPGPWGIGLGIAAAAAATTAGLQNAQNIASTTMGGGGGGGGNAYSGLSSSASVDSSAQVQPQPQPDAVAAADAFPPITVDGNSFLAKIVEEQLIPAFEDARSRGVGVVVT